MDILIVAAAVAGIVGAIARFAEIRRDRLDELDVNPLIVLGNGVVALDVLLRTAPA